MDTENEPFNDIEIPDEELEAEEPGLASDEDETPAGDDTDQSQEENDDDLVIAFGDEEIEDDSGNPTIRHLREEIRKRDRRLAEANARIPKIEVGPRPRLEDFDYDEDRHAEAVEGWVETKRQAAEQQAQGDPNEAAREEFDRDLGEYRAQRERLARPDFDAVESVVTGTLDANQQAALISVTKNKAAIVYALGKSPERLNALAAIRNPLKFATAIADIERSLKVQPRKNPPPVQPRQRGGTPQPGGRDQTLERLEKEAARTGDASKLVRYRHSLSRK